MTVSRATGHENCYFPLFIPLSYFEKEASHVDGFAKEMAVVTHHRLKADGKGGLVPDPDARLEEPLVVRPTSETVIGAAFSRWVQSWRDLPVLINQWGQRRAVGDAHAHVPAHQRISLAGRPYRACLGRGSARGNAEDAGGVPCVCRGLRGAPCRGPAEKPENERFPGAVATYSIEAMMQDGKALQAGTSHFLGTNFASAQDIKFQNAEGVFELANTTSWGMSDADDRRRHHGAW